MPLKVEPLDEPHLNLTPMLDVVFNLLIFFMLATRFSDMERQFDVQLPQVTHAAEPLTSRPDEIVINVHADGRVMINEESFTPPELQQRLEEAHARYADQAVLIRGDGHGTYQLIMDVLATCQKAQIRNYSLATRMKSE